MRPKPGIGGTGRPCRDLRWRASPPPRPSFSAAENPGFTVLIEVLGIAGVTILLRVPWFEHWVDGHVQAGT